MNNIVESDRYNFERVVPTLGDMKVVSTGDTLAGEVDTFVSMAMTGTIPTEIVRLKPGKLASIPQTVNGKTKVRYAGQAPLASMEPDQFGNLQVVVFAGSAVEVIFKSEDARRTGLTEKKKLYICD